MRTTVNLDDDLLKKAKSLSGVEETGPLLKAALAALIQRESSRRLALLGGTQPNLQYIPRRRSEPVEDLLPEPEPETEGVKS